VRRRSWEYDWVVEFDIKGLFDHIDHNLLMRAVRKHCSTPWVLLYIDRWLRAPMETPNGERVARDRGTPQGGVVSPLLANLFLHYAIDAWIRREMRSVRLCRYADDRVSHYHSHAQARLVLDRLAARLRSCGLELHPEKTRIVYCKDINRTADYPVTQFTFLGYTFWPQCALDKYGRLYVNFLPGVSRDALTAMRQTVRSWHLQLKSDKELGDLSKMFGPILRGWANYYGRFYPSALKPLWRQVHAYVVRWLRRKYRHLARGVLRAVRVLGQLAAAAPRAFVHLDLGFTPTAC